jgi:hypothetical protein
MEPTADSGAPGGDRLKGWAIFVGATVAVATATALVTWRVRRARQGPSLADVPDLIAKCFDQIHQIENDLHRLRPHTESAH